MILYNALEVYVDLQIDYLVLTNQPNRIECRVFNSPPTTLFLWHHRELLLETNLTQLVYVLTPYQFGEYTCRTSANSYSSLVREKGENKTKTTLFYYKMHLQIFSFSPTIISQHFQCLLHHR